MSDVSVKDIKLAVGSDYPMKGNSGYGPGIPGFAKYFFISSDKWKRDHSSMDGDVWFVGNGKIYKYSEDMTVQKRKKAMDEISGFFGERGLDFYKSDKEFGCFMIDFTFGDVAEEDEDDFNACFESLYLAVVALLVGWAKQNDRLMAVSTHFFQKQRWPHIHILYEKYEGEDSYPQRHLMQVIPRSQLDLGN